MWEKKRMHCFFFRKQRTICQLNPQVVSFQTVRYKISKWNICSSLLFYNHINWQMSLGNREKQISHYANFRGVMLVTTGYHTPKRPSRQDTKLHWTQRAANFLLLHTPPPAPRQWGQLPTDDKKLNAPDPPLWRTLPSLLPGLVFQLSCSLHKSTVPIQLLPD